MTKKDDKNESIGIITIIVIAALAAAALYFFLTHRPHTASTVDTIPVETPAPLPENNKVDKTS